ncbi:RnfABCDGE type electron transport complex subunit D [Allofournierella sp.]|uniref:RnfABCDGE type electron transport complex subunit D n=1 Tax=Allofournierella sp. TaxID=1940256 RepID=UPI002E7A0FF1|nr:RnfABCDGE type electron transport complex subunit D [Fournierella sp.]MEE0756092.1 RnfABCDGE type electron transport complex subunit D [Fournierella sp.]
MENRLNVTASPHIQDNSSTRKLMLNVIIALLPCVVASTIIFGARTLLVVGVTVAASVLFEYLYCHLMKKPNPVGDLSAVVTGMILALNMPVTMPLWIAIVGAFIAIVLMKQLFGGIGMNFANPALVARIVLFTGFASRMTAFVNPPKAARTLQIMGVDGASSATPLQVEGGVGKYPLMDLFMGVHGGVMGETCALAILIGLAWLLITRTITATIPVAYVGSYAVFSFLLNVGELGAADAGMLALHEVLAGGLLFGAVFMATDYVTSPFTLKGKIVFGIGLGLITFGIRAFGNMAEGVSYAILLMNLFVPYINDLTRQVPLGYKKHKKGAEKA